MMYHQLGLCLMIGMLVLFPAQGQDDTVDWQSEACMDCHDDIPEESHKTVHNPKFKVRCEDCHTDSAEHIDDPEPFNIVARGAEGQAMCLKCHEDSTHTALFSSGVHGQNTFCSDCHSAHTNPVDKLLTKKPEDLCLSCHQDVKVSFNKPFAHRSHGGTDCVSCHDIHPKDGLLPAFSLTQKCVDCHQEKQGPFVFEHVTGPAGDCLSCHEAHGSMNPMQLTRPTVAQLCLECHSTQQAPSFGSQPPAIHDMRSPRYQNCTTCHESIHGSHSSPMLLK